MDNFMPTNLQGWIVVLSAVLGALGYLLNTNVRIPMERIHNSLEKLEKHINDRLDEHDDKLHAHDVKLAEHTQAIKSLEKENK